MAKHGRRTHRNTEGRRLLSLFLGTTSQASLAASLGIGQQTVSAWKRGSCRPEPHHRDALERIARIPTDAWYSPDELAVSRGAPEAKSA